MTIFGPMLDGSQVEESVQSFIATWLPTYLGEVARQSGEDPAAWVNLGPGGNWPPQFTNSTTFNLDTTTRLPAIIIFCRGLAEPPKREGDGNYRARWIIGVGVVVSSIDQESTNKLAKRYGAALRALILQHSSLGDDNVEGIEWADENYDDVPPIAGRTLASAGLIFVIEYKHVVNSFDGPILHDPAPDPVTQTLPHDEWPTVRDPDSSPPYTPATITRSH